MANFFINRILVGNQVRSLLWFYLSQFYYSKHIKFILMKRFSLILLVSLMFINSYGQQFTEVLRTKSSNGGVVILVQSAKIDSLVNGIKPKETVSSQDKKVVELVADSVQLDSLGNPIAKGYIAKDGFRIQVFTGANSRADKELAQKLQQRSKDLFPDLKTYCSFISPRWVVRIGDFASREEAMSRLAEVRETGISKEVRLVKCKVQIPVY